MIRLFVTTSVFISLMAVTVAYGVLSSTSVNAAEPTHNADFRIIDVSDHQSYLLIEVEHFKTDGTFDYFENYIWQGREGKKFPTLANAEGRRYMDNGELAPFTVDPASPPGNYFEYLPPGRSWKIDYDPRIDRNALLTVIEGVHKKRSNWADSDWPKGYKTGQSRLSEPGMKYDQSDADGIFSLIVKFQNLTDTAYTIKESETPRRYIGELPPVNPGEGKFEYGTVATFYPHVGDSVDGYAKRQVASTGDTWASMYGGAGTAAVDSGTSYYANINTGTNTNTWFNFWRVIQLYDTSSLGSGSTVTAATMEIVAMAPLYDQLSPAQSLAMVTSNPASDTAIVAADFDVSLFSSTRQSPDKLISTITADSSTYTSYILNATGLSNISKTGTTKFGLRISGDADNSTPTWGHDDLSAVQIASAEETLPGDKRPRLVVTYTPPPPSAVITGTIGDGATEQEVRDGGGTILITVSDDTWVATGATFDAQRQAIIDGLDAASSPTTGWNNEVRDKLGVSSVVRTSDTLATITLSASEVAGYAIASGETITVTIPAAALTLAGAVTATPTIAITAVTESAAITGTIGDGATEQEVRDGGGTILITLSNTTWAEAAGSLFDNQRQNIINGMVAADSQTYGWNNEVKDRLGVTAVVRTSDTLVTITIPAGDVEDYRIVTNEVITTTVPATAIGGAALVAAPTTTITGSVESVAVSGTLGGSGGTAAEIEAGGETVIITLTNTTWVSAGATFNAQRQNILDGLVADDSDINGWNAMAFAVGDVVRTSGTIVTITLSAESGYAIPSSETVTTTVPASAMAYGGALVAPETFTITPSAFVTSGTRVSTAINLASITNLAYCAIGWETTLPTDTSVAIATSVDGGSNYSTAINGNCPIGLTVGESLESITDFRVQATLTTTNTAVTPLITALGLILEDAGGSELCYQLLTTPSASLSDNCGIYTGTMSYPIGPSSITSSTAPITSTADLLPDARALAGQDVAQAVTGSATSAKLFPDASEGGGFTGLPLNDLVNEMSTVGDGLPVRFVWFIFLGIATIGAGMMAVHLTSNLFIAAGAMAAVMGFQMAIGTTGLLPGWILFAFIPLAAAYLLFRRGFPA